MNIRYRNTEEELENAVRESTSVSGVMRKLGIRVAGGNYRNIKLRIDRLGIDRKHFTGQAHNKGKRATNRKSAVDILIDRTGKADRHSDAARLRRSLIEIGRSYECAGCQNSGTWEGYSITLEVDHVNGNWLDDRKENLRFLCPNCHSQTPTFGNKNRKIDNFKAP